MKKDYQTIAETYLEWDRKLRNACIKHLCEILKKEESIVLDWDELEEMGLDPITISYDGGNHSEYASNVFATVKKIYWDEDEGGIVVDVEGGTMEVYRITTDDIYTICDFIDSYIESRKKS